MNNNDTDRMDRLFCVFGVEEQQTRRDFTRNGSFDISSTFWISLSNYNTIKNAVINFKWVIKYFYFKIYDCCVTGLHRYISLLEKRDLHVLSITLL